MEKKVVDRGSPAYLQDKVGAGRHSLLLIIVFTLVNLAMVLLDSGVYFLFSASVPYYLTLYCKGMDNFFMEGDWPVNGPYTNLALLISAVILLLFLLCWLLSGKHTLWLIPAVVLLVLDTLALVWCAVYLVYNPADTIVDFLVHFWALWELIRAIRCGGRLKKLPPAELPVLTEE